VRCLLTIPIIVIAAIAVCPSAFADDWWPHSKDTTWTYQWTDSTYATTPTIEKVTVKDGADAKSFTLAWTTKDEDLKNDPLAIDSNGTMSFQTTSAGINNTDWSSNPPPPAFPVLCSQLARCGNSLASTLYTLIWGGRSPVLEEPLLQGMSWSSTGGAGGDVTSTSTYEGVEPVTVPAFADPVVAAKVRTEITQAGALGDPYGSGVRTVWWVYGVGPVKIDFQHSGGSDAPDTTSVLTNTTLMPAIPPSDANYFPLVKGTKLRYRWVNAKHLPKPEVEELTIDEVSNGAARFTATALSGPIRVAGSYGFVLRLDGLTNIWGAVQAATLAKLPSLGPGALPAAQRRHFFTPFDLMVFGFNPVLTAYPAGGDTWHSANPSRDFSVYGVNGTTRVVGLQAVTVPAGKFTALVVASSLDQLGFPFGSGTRTCWFAPGKGLVKLVFRHGDHSTSTVELLK
jgi:hypothetical protein